MSVAKRPFADPRNTYIVDNNDPGAFDKSHQGIPGTHTEQRCCGDRAPYMEGESLQTGYYVNDRGEYFLDANGAKKHRPNDPNVETPAGYKSETVFRPTELWCHECEIFLEKAW
jgi:hypothetical protein